MFGPSDQFPLRGKGGAEGTKGVCKRTVSLGAKRRRDTVRRQSERSEVVHFHERSEVVWFSKCQRYTVII